MASILWLIQSTIVKAFAIGLHSAMQASGKQFVLRAIHRYTRRSIMKNYIITLISKHKNGSIRYHNWRVAKSFAKEKHSDCPR